MGHYTERLKRKKSPGCATVLLLIIGGLVLLSWIVRQGPSPDNGALPQTQPRRTQTTNQTDDTAARALEHGSGYDWNKLSDRDKKDLCLRAAKALGKDSNVAWEYNGFLRSFYSKAQAEGNHELLTRTIRENIAVCQAMIDKGLIEVEE